MNNGLFMKLTAKGTGKDREQKSQSDRRKVPLYPSARGERSKAGHLVRGVLPDGRAAGGLLEEAEQVADKT